MTSLGIVLLEILKTRVEGARQPGLRGDALLECCMIGTL